MPLLRGPSPAAGSVKSGPPANWTGCRRLQVPCQDRARLISWPKSAARQLGRPGYCREPSLAWRAAGLRPPSLRLRLAGSLAGRTEAPFEPEDIAAAVDGRAGYRESTGSDQVPVDLMAPPGRRAAPSPSRRASLRSESRRDSKWHPRAIKSRGEQPQRDPSRIVLRRGWQ